MDPAWNAWRSIADLPIMRVLAHTELEQQASVDVPPCVRSIEGVHSVSSIRAGGALLVELAIHIAHRGAISLWDR